MITLKRLKWSNAFSYGEDNEIVLDEHKIIQLLGKNGHGKSSIGLILEEVNYNKNSKGVKKADILNRYLPAKSYTLEEEFEKDGDTYTIRVVRGSTQTVKFTCNGVDISSHTATATFKNIEDTLGFDAKTFSQLIYQSSASSLEFLTATDTNRKKFLIDLLNLTKYVDAFEVFKALAKEVSDELNTIETKISTTQSWLDKNSKIPLEKKVILPSEPTPTVEMEEEAKLKAKINDIVATNKRITQNNQYKKLLNDIPVEDLSKAVEKPEDVSPYVKELTEANKEIKDARAFILRMGEIKDECPTCKQFVDNSKSKELVAEKQAIVASFSERVQNLEKLITKLDDEKRAYDRVIKHKTEWENYHSLIDPSLPETIFDKEELDNKVSELQKTITNIRRKIEEIETHNTQATAHNSKIDVISEQMDVMRADLAEYSKALKEVSDKLNIVQLLQKTFSTNGLIAYKIECLVKDLEELTNSYLAELSGGRFQITFKVVSDKLNVIIIDNGKEIDILSLSTGELARVNTATLLAIRKLMQQLSSARINLLILDETIESLDVDGKEKLIEVLLEEEHLNTILISHGYTHPLLEKITVVKENNISRIE